MDHGTFERSVRTNPGITPEIADHLCTLSLSMKEEERVELLRGVDPLASDVKRNRNEAIDLSTEGLSAVKEEKHVIRDETERAEHDDELAEAEKSLQNL